MTWNIPNMLTILRFLLVPVLLVFILQQGFTAKLISLMIFIIAAVTDFLDGKLARLFNQKSEFGKFADPLADKFLVLAALIAFIRVEEIMIPFWIVFLILMREFLITGLRIAALSRNDPISTSMLGKVKTTAQMVTISIILFLLLTRAYVVRNSVIGLKGSDPDFWLKCTGSEFWGTVLQYTPLFLMSITAFLTVFSGIRYLVKNKKIIFGGN